MRDPFPSAECCHGRQYIRRQSPAQEELGELEAVSGIPNLFEICRMERIYERVRGFAHEERVVDGERFVEKWQQ